VRALTSRGIHVVVIDIDKDRIDELMIEGLDFDVPCLVADAADPNNLLMSGIAHRYCAGLVALTNNEQANLSIALSGKLLAPELTVICRAEHQETGDNMLSFGTDYAINPFETYADLLTLAIRSPYMRVLYEWLTSPEVRPICKPLSPPMGRWIICGYGRFGKALCKHLALEGVETVVVEATPKQTDAPAEAITGKGTEAITLRQAGVMDAVALVAGTDNGADNLSILMTAKQMKPELFIVARQTLRKNTPLFEAANADLIIQPARVVARKVLAIIQNPLLADFLELARQKDDLWAMDLLEGISHMAGGQPVDTWNLRIDEQHAPAACDLLNRGEELSLIDVLRNPTERQKSIYARILLLKRGEASILLPGLGMDLQKGDQLLLGGLPSAQKELNWTLCNHNVIDYTKTGNERPAGVVWRWLSERDTQ
jgi:Trk K+ transport system NAD-binding subunit